MNIQCPWCESSYILHIDGPPVKNLVTICPKCGGDHLLKPPSKIDTRADDTHVPTITEFGSDDESTRSMAHLNDSNSLKGLELDLGLDLTTGALDFSENTLLTGEKSAIQLAVKLDDDVAIIKDFEQVEAEPLSLELDFGADPILQEKPELDMENFTARNLAPAPDMGIEMGQKPKVKLKSDKAQPIRLGKGAHTKTPRKSEKMRAKQVYGSQQKIKGAKKTKSKMPLYFVLAASLAGGAYVYKDVLLTPLNTYLNERQAGKTIDGDHVFKSQLEVWAESIPATDTKIDEEFITSQLMQHAGSQEKLDKINSLLKQNIVSNGDSAKVVAEHLVMSESINQHSIERGRTSIIEKEESYFETLKADPDLARLTSLSLAALRDEVLTTEDMRWAINMVDMPLLRYPIALRYVETNPGSVQTYCLEVLKTYPDNNLHKVLLAKSYIYQKKYARALDLKYAVENQDTWIAEWLMTEYSLCQGDLKAARKRLLKRGTGEQIHPQILGQWYEVFVTHGTSEFNAAFGWERVRESLTTYKMKDKIGKVAPFAFAARDFDYLTRIQKEEIPKSYEVEVSILNAQKLMHDKKYGEARVMLDKVYKDNLNNDIYLETQAEIATLSGIAHWLSEEKSSAFDRFKRAINDDPLCLEAMILSVLAYSERGDFENMHKPYRGIRYGDIGIWRSKKPALPLYIDHDLMLDLRNQLVKKYMKSIPKREKDLLSGVISYASGQYEKADSALTKYGKKSRKDDLSRMIRMMMASEKNDLKKLGIARREFLRTGISTSILSDFFKGRYAYLKSTNSKKKNQNKRLDPAEEALIELTKKDKYFAPAQKYLSYILEEKGDVLGAIQAQKFYVELRFSDIDARKRLLELQQKVDNKK